MNFLRFQRNPKAVPETILPAGTALYHGSTTPIEGRLCGPMWLARHKSKADKYGDYIHVFETSRDLRLYVLENYTAFAASFPEISSHDDLGRQIYIVEQHDYAGWQVFEGETVEEILSIPSTEGTTEDRMNFLRFKRTPIEYLYHVTYYNRLESISTRGLRPNQPRSIGGESYDFHRKRRVFLTEGPGVFFWHSRAEAFAEHNSDNIIEDGLVPVVLRVLRSAIEEDNDLELDEIGTRDSGGHESWMLVNNIILPEDLEVWSGERWVPVDEYHGTLDPEVAVDVEYDEDDEYYSFKNESPLFPPELHP